MNLLTCFFFLIVIVVLYGITIPLILFRDNVISYHKKIGLIGIIIASAIFVFFFGVVVGAHPNDDKPQAIDVYRSNTDLQITYKTQANDTISIDTVVVFK